MNVNILIGKISFQSDWDGADTMTKGQSKITKISTQVLAKNSDIFMWNIVQPKNSIHHFILSSLIYLCAVGFTNEEMKYQLQIIIDCTSAL